MTLVVLLQASLKVGDDSKSKHLSLQNNIFKGYFKREFAFFLKDIFKTGVVFMEVIENGMLCTLFCIL